MSSAQKETLSEITSMKTYLSTFEVGDKCKLKPR